MRSVLIVSFSKISARRLHTFGIGSFVASSKILRTATSALLVGISYYVGTWIGFAWTPSGQPISTFWPPNAVLLAAFLLAPRQRWWTFLLAVFPAHIIAQLHVGVPLWTAVGWFITNTSEALIGAFCITRFHGPGKMLDSVRGLLVFVVFGVLLAPFATSFLDAFAVVITRWGRGYWPLSLERFWSNAFADLTIVPLIVLCVSNRMTWIRRVTVTSCSEVTLVAIATVLAAVCVFGFPPLSPAATPALLYVPLPFLLWAAARFGLLGLGFSILSVALISMWFTLHGHKPFPYASLPDNILSLQILFCVAVVPLMFLSAVMAESRRAQAELRKISTHLIGAQEQERRRIARELHDNLAQQLALVKANLDQAIDVSDEPLKSGLIDVADQVMGMSHATHEISHGLYPTQLEYLGLASAVKRLCQDMRSRQLVISFDTDNVPNQLQPSISLCLYRVAQESLHNVVRHSQANDVRVQLAGNDGRILLRITDNGLGFDLSYEKRGLGLLSMRQRVVSVGGRIEITSSPNAGTQIEVWVPLCKDDVPNAA
jgi:signal transduction histidine kinase